MAKIYHDADADLEDLAGETLAVIEGSLRAILTAERAALNFLMRLCGVATFTRRFVDAVEGTGCKIVDTRKTLPGWRVLDKYAAAIGGARNHRLGLSDGILLKDNHIAAAGGVVSAVKLALAEEQLTLSVTSPEAGAATECIIEQRPLDASQLLGKVAIGAIRRQDAFSVHSRQVEG